MSAAETRRPDRLPGAMEPWAPGYPSAVFPPLACLKAGAVQPLSIASHADSLSLSAAPVIWKVSNS